MIWIGRFKENYNDDKYPSIFTAVCKTAPNHKATILYYLKKCGILQAISLGNLYDVINPDIVITNPACINDGIYAWRSDLIHYYEKYNVALPEEFIRHVLQEMHIDESL